MRRRAGAGAPVRTGFALLVVLWTLVLLSFMAARLVTAGRTEILIAGNVARAAALQALADGAVHEAAFHLREGSWAANGAPHLLAASGAALTVSVRDEADRIDLNRAPPALLAAALSALGEPAPEATRLAGAIAAWRGPTANLSARDKAAEYRAAGLDYAPPETPFRSLDELGMVIGMRPELLDRLRPHLTLFSTHGPNPDTADPVARAALSVAPGVPADDARPEVDVFSVAAEAVGAAGGRATRRAVARFERGTGGERLHVLAWER